MKSSKQRFVIGQDTNSFDYQSCQLYIMPQSILVTGPFGQIGAELVPQLQKMYGVDNVICFGNKKIPSNFNGVVEKADITDTAKLQQVFKKYKITQVYHIRSVLSVLGEENPNQAWEVNLIGLKNMFDLCVEFKVEKIFWGSSIAVFGPTTPKEQTPQHTSIEPTTMYGITKHAGQLLAQYYFNRYGLDVRSIRYPGIISWKELPGMGTTGYAVQMFYGALTNGKYHCYLAQQTRLPMMYIDDTIKAIISIMQASPQQIKVRTSYNLSAINFTPAEIANAIRKHVPLEVIYEPDHRQQIADSWPHSIDDSEARKDWGWSHSFGVEQLVCVMVENLGQKIKKDSNEQ